MIVPIYCVEKFLDRCISSIVSQTYQNLEIILVEDASPDNSGKICDEWAKKDERISVIHKEINEGLGLTRNRGIEKASGVYITFIDSDDWIGINHIQNLYNEIKNAQAQICIGGCTRVSKEGKERQFKTKLTKKIYEKKEVVDEILLPLIAPDTDYLPDIQVDSSSCMNLYSLELIKSNGINFPSEREAIAEDFFFNIDCFYCAEKVVTSDIISYFYFENTGSISRKYNAARFSRTIEFYHRLKNKIKNYNLENVVRYRAERGYIGKIRLAVKQVVASDLEFIDKIKTIKNMIKHEVTQEVLQIYPIRTYSKGLMIVAMLMKYKQALLLYFAMKLRMKMD